MLLLERAKEITENTELFKALKEEYAKEHRAWINRRALTQCEKHSNFKNYGGKGITVCERWSNCKTHKESRQSFINFLQDVGPAPSEEHQIDRIDSNGNYEPGNVRWATPKEQSRNKKNTVMVEGRPFIELCEAAGVDYHTAYSRYFKYGYSLEDALAPLSK